MTLQKIKEEARKEFDFVFEDNGVIQTYTRGNGGSRRNTTAEELQDFIDSLIDKAYEEGKRENEKECEELQKALDFYL